jgi:hypothetical protein
VAESKSQTFSGVTPAQYATLIEQAKAAGVEISGNTGRASKMGIEVAWNYSEEAQQLELTCLHTPFFVTTEQVNTRLRNLVTQALAS